MNQTLRRIGAWQCLGVLVGLACAVTAQAQSTYVLSTLKPATSAAPLRASVVNPWFIDANDHVLGTAEYFTGYTWLLSALAFRPVYTAHVSRWPATTASSVSPSKWVSSANSLASASPNGRLLMLTNGDALYDVSSKKVVGALPASPRALAGAVNNAGTALGTTYETRTVPLVPGSPGVYSWQISHAATWTAATGLTMLPEGSAASSDAHAINASGTVAGSVTDDATRLQQAALWVGGTLQRLPQAAQSASAAIQINDKGQMLIRREPLVSCPPESLGLTNCYVNVGAVYLYDNGVEVALMPPDATRWISSAFLNNQGVVVGRYRTGALGGTQHLGPSREESFDAAAGRAFIWQKGVFADLTDWVKSKGVGLPSGAVLTQAVALNDRGSIVAQLRLSNGTTSMVRLTARP